MKAGAGLPMKGDMYLGVPPVGGGDELSPWRPRPANFSAACWRYSQLAQPAQAKMARMNRTAKRTRVLRFKGNDLFFSIVRG